MLFVKRFLQLSLVVTLLFFCLRCLIGCTEYVATGDVTTCEECDGSGEIGRHFNGTNQIRFDECRLCQGTGILRAMKVKDKADNDSLTRDAPRSFSRSDYK